MMQLAMSQSNQSEPNFIRIKTAIEKIDFPSFSSTEKQGFDRAQSSKPNRQQIREENYRRRHLQMSSMGFQTPINVPYKPIGETYDILNINADRDQSSYDQKVMSALRIRSDTVFELNNHTLILSL